jgi:hypothetical protein
MPSKPKFSEALEYHEKPRPGKIGDPGHQADRHPVRSEPGLHPRSGRPLPGDRRRPRRGVPLHQPGQPGGSGLQRDRRPRPGQHRRPGRKAGDGRQGGAVQAVRRHRRLRPRDRCLRPRRCHRFCEMLAPTVGGINLEDIKAPECFLHRVRRSGIASTSRCSTTTSTARPSSAAPPSSTRSRSPTEDISETRVVVSGAGAAGVACARFLHRVGVDPEPRS